MPVLILSPDDDAAQSLGSALQRRGIAYSRALPTTQDEVVLVAVIDVALDNYEELQRSLLERAPWSRFLLIADRYSDPSGDIAPAFRKPFDAAALAELIEHERELALLERRRRSSAAQAEELGLLLQSSLEAIIGFDLRGRIVFWNRGAERIYGYSEQEALGATVALLEAPKAGPRHVKVADGEVGEVVRRHKLGHDVTVVVSRSLAPESVATQRIQCAEVSLDVTRQRALERELEHSRRLAHLGRIAATLSHEINNPLAAIRSYSSWLQMTARRSKDNDLIDVSNDLDRASERIATFVDQMTGFARRGTPNLESVPLKKCLSLSMRMVRPRADAQGVSLMDLTDEFSGTVVPHDPTRLGHAVINVLSNAIDAAAQGGKHVWLRLMLTDADATIEVDDDGQGIDPENRQRVFEPFYTTKPFGRGTGLGLWLTEQILTDHEGKVTLTARPEAGTRVQLVLPRRASATLRAALKEPR